MARVAVIRAACDRALEREDETTTAWLAADLTAAGDDGADYLRRRARSIRDARDAVDRMWLALRRTQGGFADLGVDVRARLRGVRDLVDHDGEPIPNAAAAKLAAGHLPAELTSCPARVLVDVFARWRVPSSHRRRQPDELKRRSKWRLVEKRIGDVEAVQLVLRGAGHPGAESVAAIRKALSRRPTK